MVSQLHGALPPHGVFPPPMLVEWYLSHAMRIWVFSMGSLVLAPEGGFAVGLGIRIFKLVPKKNFTYCMDNHKEQKFSNSHTQTQDVSTEKKRATEKKTLGNLA